MELSKTYITNKGRALMAKAGAGAQIVFTTMATSSKSYPEDTPETTFENLEILQNIKQQTPVSDVQVRDDVCVDIVASVGNRNLTQGYKVCCLGFYANDPTEGEILYAVAPVIPGTEDWFPGDNGKNASSLDITLTIQVGNSANVAIDVDSGAYVSVTSFNKLKSKTDVLSNPNILINGDFSNPVNQRNLTKYGRLGTGSTLTKPGYTIDRWIKKCEASTVEILDDCIRFSIGNTVMARDVKFGQSLEFPKSYAGKTVTLSTGIKEIVGYIELGLFYGYEEHGCLPDMSICSILIDKPGTYSVTAKIPEDFDGTYLTFMYYMRNNVETGQIITSDDYVDIKWAKMECGEVATTFTPRLRGGEMMLCQRFYENFLHSMLCVIPTSTSKTAVPLMGFKVKKRTIPKITSDGFYSYANSATKLDTRQDNAVVNTNGITYIQLTEAVGATMCYIKNMEVDAEIY